MGRMRVVFVPGFGRDGEAAWPGQAPALLGAGIEACYLLQRDTLPGPDAVIAALGDGAHVVAHSAGGVSATLAASRHPELVHSLTLVEPACFALARGGAEVERHIARMAPAFALACTGIDDAALATEFLTAMEAPLPPQPMLAPLGERIRIMPPPWEHQVDGRFLRLVRTVVVTGAWSPLYDEVARSLAAAGAAHAVIPGHEHRPHDDSSFAELLLAHWRG